MEKEGTAPCRVYVAREFRCDVSGFSGVPAGCAGGVHGTEAALLPRRLVVMVRVSELWVREIAQEQVR